MPVSFDPVAGRFRSNGRYVRESVVRQTIDEIAEGTADLMGVLTKSLVAGDIPLAKWQGRMRNLLKAGHAATAVIATGGREAMTPADWGRLGVRIKAEYQHLDAFAAGIASGTVPLDGHVPNRAGLYGQASRATYEHVRARGDRSRGYQAERNVQGSSKGCPMCAGETAKGWVEIGTLLPVGGRTCVSACKCWIERRKAPA